MMCQRVSNQTNLFEVGDHSVNLKTAVTEREIK